MFAGFASLVIRHPLSVIGMVFCALVAAALGMSQLQFDDGYEGIFSSRTPEYQRYLAFKRGFSDTSTNIAILVRSSTGFDTAALHQLQELALDVHLLDGVEAVFSLFSLQRFNTDTQELEPVFQDLEGEDLDRLIEEAAQTSFSGLSLISDDGKKTTLIVSFDDAYERLRNAQRGLDGLRQLTGAFSTATSMEAVVSGLLPIRERVVQQVRLDQPVINLLGAILGFCVSLYIFKSVWIALLNGVAPVVALVLSLGFLGLFDFNINVINTALPVLILVLASSDCTHMTYEFRNQFRAGSRAEDAIHTATTETAPACFLASITTALAFASLSFSSSPIIRELAIGGAMSVLLGLGAVLLIHPLVFLVASRFRPVRAALTRPLSADTTLKERRLLFEWLLARKTPIVACGLACGGVAVWLSLPIQTSYRFFENINPDDHLVEALAELEAFSGPMTSIEFPVAIAGRGDLLAAQQLAEIGRIHEALEEFENAAFAVTSVHTLSRFLQSHGASNSPENLNAVLEILPPQYLHRIIREDRDGYLLSVLVPDIGSERLIALSQRLWREIERHPTSAIDIAQPTGLLSLSAERSDKLIKQLVLSFLAAALACPLLIGFWFRRVDFAVFAIIPNLLPVVMIGAWLHLSGNDLQFASALALTIAFGIAVDDSIHVFNRLDLETKRNAGRRTQEIIVAAMVRVSPALITTTVILSAGLITVLWSDMPMIEYFGLLCIATFFLALVTDVFLLPGLVSLGTGRQRKLLDRSE